MVANTNKDTKHMTNTLEDKEAELMTNILDTKHMRNNERFKKQMTNHAGFQKHQ